MLRTAIGWHFLVEGLDKVNPPDGKEFSAEGYLRASTGPFAEHFRSIIPDVDATQRLARDESGKPAGLKELWRQELDLLDAHFQLDESQRRDAESALEAASLKADEWFLLPDNAEKITKYLADLRKVRAVESNPKALSYERELAQKGRREIESTRKELAGVIDEWTAALSKTWTEAGTPSPEQAAAHGELKRPLTQLDLVNNFTKWGLTIAGACLMLGLFTPLAALTGAALLCTFYLSMPPWPGLPVAPNAEGHYLFVNKNLVEMFACLVIASTPNGLWIGLDSLLFGWIGQRGRETGLPAPLKYPSGGSPPGSNPILTPPDRPRGSSDPRQPIPLSGSPR